MASHGEPDPNCRACMRASFAAKRPAACADHAPPAPSLAWLRDSLPTTSVEPLDERATAATESEAARAEQMARCTRCRELRADDPDATCRDHEPVPGRTWHEDVSFTVMPTEQFERLVMSI